MTTNLKKAPAYIAVREYTTAPVADPVALTLANFPITLGFDPKAHKIGFYWLGTGAVPADTITLDLLELSTADPGADEGYWVKSGEILQLPPQTLAVLETGVTNLVCLRVAAVGGMANVSAAKVYAAQYSCSL